MRTVLNRIFSVLGVVLIIAGLSIFLYPEYRNWKMYHTSDKVMEEIIRDWHTKTESDGDEKPLHPKDLLEEVNKRKMEIQPELYASLSAYNTSLLNNGQTIVDAWSYEAPPVDLSLNGNSSLIGTLSIPDMKVKNMPLYLGASPTHLSEGAAVMSSTSMPIGGENTNCAIAGHRGYRGSAYFQFIEDLRAGSLIYITNPWETLVYRVVGTEIVSPNNTSGIMIQEGKDMVTLVSCHPYVIGGGPERFLAYAERVKDEELVTQVQDEDVRPKKVSGVSDANMVNIVGGSSPLIQWEEILRRGMAIFLFICIAFIFFHRLYNKKRNHRNDTFC